MKKILLASACLLTLTACSMPNQHKQENKPKQNQSQSKVKEEKVKTKTFSKKSMSIIPIQSSFSIQKKRLYLFNSSLAKLSLKKIKR